MQQAKKRFSQLKINEKSCNTPLVKIISLSGCEKSPSHVNKVSPFAHNNNTYSIAALNIDDNLGIFYYHITYYLIILHLLEICHTSHIIALTSIVFYINNYRYGNDCNKEPCISIQYDCSIKRLTLSYYIQNTCSPQKNFKCQYFYFEYNCYRSSHFLKFISFFQSKIVKLPGRKNVLTSHNQIRRSFMR